MLDPFARDIWIADGSTVTVLGFHYPTRCAVIRLNADDLLIWSPVTLTPALKDRIDQLGRVTHLIAPNSFHHLFVAQWQAAYPTALLYGTAALHKKRPDLEFAGTLQGTPDAAWAAVLDQIVVPHKLTTEVVFFHKPSRTVIFTDLIQQFDAGTFRGWRKFIARLDLMIGNTPQVPRKFRLGFGRRSAARQTIGAILGWPIENILLAHGAPVKGTGKAALRDAFAWLIK